MRHVTEDREYKLLRWPVCPHDLEQQRDDAVAGSVLLTLFTETAEIKHGIEHLIRDLSKECLPLFHRKAEHIDQKVNCIRRVQRLEHTRAHGHVLDELEHGDLVGGGHSSEILEHRCIQVSYLVANRSRENILLRTCRSATVSLTYGSACENR